MGARCAGPAPRFAGALTVDTIDNWHVFAPSHWARDRRASVQALWDWYHAIPGVLAHTRGEGTRLQAAARRLESGVVDEFLPAAVARNAVDACERLGLELSDLAMPLQLAGLPDTAVPFESFGAVEEAMRLWPMTLGRMLGKAAGIGRNWQVGVLDDLSTAHFLCAALWGLRETAESQVLWIPRSELEAAGVSEGELRKRQAVEGTRQVLFKQAVRVRDRMARCLALYLELPRSFRMPFRRWWMAMLQVIEAVERRDYDVWRAADPFSPVQQGKIYLQSVFARAAFKRR